MPLTVYSNAEQPQARKIISIPKRHDQDAPLAKRHMCWDFLRCDLGSTGDEANAVTAYGSAWRGHPSCRRWWVALSQLLPTWLMRQREGEIISYRLPMWAPEATAHLTIDECCDASGRLLSRRETASAMPSKSTTVRSGPYFLSSLTAFVRSHAHCSECSHARCLALKLPEVQDTVVAQLRGSSPVTLPFLHLIQGELAKLCYCQSSHTVHIDTACHHVGILPLPSRSLSWCPCSPGGGANTSGDPCGG